MSERRITSTDIARALGISQATVSYVLTGRAREVGVSEATAERVLAKASQLGYRANRLAQGLKGGRTHVVGIVAPCVTFSYFSQIVRGADDVLSQHDYVAVLMHTDENAERERRKIDILRGYRVDGLLVIPASVGVGAASAAVFRELQQDRCPFVLVDKTVAGIRAPFVGTDDEAGAKAMEEYLVSLGHRRLACLRGPADVSTIQQRLRGFRAGLAAHGLRLDPRLVEGDTWEEEGAADAATRLLRATPRPTAVFALTDVLARGVYRAAAAAGLRIPQDLSVVGFADLEFAALLCPPLTTVRQPAHELGCAAAEMLLRLMTGAGTRPPPRQLLPVELVVRGSCAAP